MTNSQGALGRFQSLSKCHDKTQGQDHIIIIIACTGCHPEVYILVLVSELTRCNKFCFSAKPKSETTSQLFTGTDSNCTSSRLNQAWFWKRALLQYQIFKVEKFHGFSMLSRENVTHAIVTCGYAHSVTKIVSVRILPSCEICTILENFRLYGTYSHNYIS